MLATPLDEKELILQSSLTDPTDRQPGCFLSLVIFKRVLAGDCTNLSFFSGSPYALPVAAIGTIFLSKHFSNAVL
jgi:hypothetical protein